MLVTSIQLGGQFCMFQTHLSLIQFSTIFLKVKHDSNGFVIFSKLLHSFTVYGKNEFQESLTLNLKFMKSQKRVV